MTELKENTHYIFTFGNTEVGKSSMLSSLCDFIQYSKKFQLRKNPIKNPKGNKFLRKNWLHRYRRNLFPPRSDRGVIYEIDVGIQEFQEEYILPITFLEMSGEDLMILDSMYDDEELSDLKARFYEYIEASKILMLVTTPSNCMDDDLTFDELFEIFDQQSVQIPTALIINKADELENEDKLKSYVSTNMPNTFKWMYKVGANSPTKVFAYSTGIPDLDDPELYTIKQKNHKEYAPKLLHWIYELLEL